MPADAASLSFAPAGDDDFDALLTLRMLAMHESLQRLGRFDPQRARERLSRAFEPRHTRHILQAGERMGFVVVLPEPGQWVLDHLYIAPAAQRRGIGSWVLAQVLAEADSQRVPVAVTALRLSDANRFYQRHGFVLQSQQAWDLHYVRPVGGAHDAR